MVNPVLQVEGLNIATTTGVPIVTGVSFQLQAGIAQGLVGESGSGKTLTGLACLDLLPRSVEIVGGRVTVDGTVVVDGAQSRARRGRRRVSMVFQNPMTSLNPSMRVGAQVAEALRRNRPGTSRAAAARDAVELLELVDIPEPQRRAGQWPHELSGGQRQRVVIAMALACDARVLIADEPTTALDVTTQAGVVALLERLRSQLGLAVLFISHDLALVSQVCSTTMVMYAGEIVESGPTYGILSRPAHPYLAGLLRCLPERSDGLIVPLPGRVPSPGTYPPGCRFAARCQHRDDRCSKPQTLLSISDARTVRCVRHHEVSGASPASHPEVVLS